MVGVNLTIKLTDEDARSVMKIIVGILCVFSVVFPLPAQQYAPDSTGYDFIFHMPTGWNRVDRADGTVLFAPLPAPAKAFIALLPPVDLKPDLRGAFNTQWQAILQEYRMVEGGQVESHHFPRGFDALVTGAVVSDRSNRNWSVYLMVAENGAHAETLIYMCNVGDSFLLEALRHVTESIGFSGTPGHPRTVEASKPVGMPRGTGNLNGIYRSIGVVGDYGLSGSTKLTWRYILFLQDGRFWEGFPAEGMDSLDEDAEIRRDPVGWGTYSPSGGPQGDGKIVFLITDPATQKEPIVWDYKEYKDHLVVDRFSYTLLERCDGMRLEGTFRRAGYNKLSTADQKGITFTTDGQFVDEGAFAAAGVLVRHAVGLGEDFDDGRPGRGAYRVANYTLELKYSDGRIKRTSIFLEPGASKQNVREFYLNTFKFTRVQ